MHQSPFGKHNFFSFQDFDSITHEVGVRVWIKHPEGDAGECCQGSWRVHRVRIYPLHSFSEPEMCSSFF